MSNYPHWSTRVHPRHHRSTTRRPAANPDLLAAVAARLTPRDRWLLAMLGEHRVFTTAQITALAYTSTRVALARLTMLHAHRVLARARPHSPAPGSAPWHWVLDATGAQILAADTGQEHRRWRPDRTQAVLHGQNLAHTIGTNQVFIDLAAHTRTHIDARLLAWWGEARCAGHVGDIIRPDGYGHWHQAGRDVELFCEYDTGTEPVTALAAKARRYAELTETTGRAVPAAFVLPTPAREAAVRRALPDELPMPVVTTHTRLLATAGPAGPSWHLHHHTERLRLGELPATPGPPLSTMADPLPAPAPTPPAPADKSGGYQ